MSQQGQWMVSPSVEPPAKRRRGRPRKIPSPLTTRADSSVKSTNMHGVASSGPASNESVGQPVSGVIEGSFDDGYLVNVKLPNSDINMRGAVFLPGRYIPVTRATDVAPQVPMIPRVNIDPPFLQPQSKSVGLTGVTLGEKAHIAETDSADLSATILAQKARESSEQYGQTIAHAGVSLGEKSQIPEIDYSDPSGSAATLTQKAPKVSEVCSKTFGSAGVSLQEKAQIAETDLSDLSATILAQKARESSEQYGKTIGQAGVSLGEKSPIPEIDYSDPSGSAATLLPKANKFLEMCTKTFGPAGFSLEGKAQIAETDSVDLSATILAQKACELSQQYGKTIGSTGVVSVRQNRQIAEIDSRDQSATILAHEAGEVSDPYGNLNATEIIDEAIGISMLSGLNDKTEEDSNDIFNLNGMAGRDSDISFTDTNSHFAPPTGLSEANLEGKGCILRMGVDSDSLGAEKIEDDNLDADITNTEC